MILTVTLNPAYDLTYRLPKFEYGAVQRIPAVEQRIGGKGINVARILTKLGHDCVAMGFADSAFAEEAARELPVDFVTALPRVRRTVVISEADGTTTGLWEPGATLNDPDAADLLRRRVADRLPRARGLVISGSLPGGADPRLPADLAGLAIAADVPVICDVEGEALRAAARVQGVVLMPNADELPVLTGVAPDAATASPVRDSAAAHTAQGFAAARAAHEPAAAHTAHESAAAHAAQDLAAIGTSQYAAVRRALDVAVALQRPLRLGVAAIVATRGRAGLVAAVQGAAWSAAASEAITGNPTGAGDAAAAALIAGLAALPKLPATVPEHGEWPEALRPGWLDARELDWPALLADVVATSAAAVARPVAGEIDQDLRTRLTPAVRVTPVRTRPH